MFFVNVQSCSVHNACYLWIRYFVIQSCFLSTMPPFSCGYFLRDFHDFLHSHFHLCLSQHHYLIALHQPPAEMLQPGRCPSSHFTEDSGVLISCLVHSRSSPVYFRRVFDRSQLLRGLLSCTPSVYFLSSSFW